MPDGADSVWRLIDGAANMHVLGAFVELGIADVVPDDGLAVSELAQRLHADRSMLERLLRAAAALDLCELSDGVCRLSPSAVALRSGNGDTLRVWAALMTAPWLQRAWSRLAEVVRQPHDPFVVENGESFWDYLSSHASAQVLFDRAMAGGAGARARAAAQVIQRLNPMTIVDVGGGDGSLLAAVVDACPSAHGVLAERAATIEHAAAARRHPRIEPVECDLFHDVPPRGDLYVLSRVLHDHDDQRAIIILRHVREAMTDSAYLLVLESVVPPWESLDQADQLALAMKDLNMLVLVGGRERTLDEYERLFASADLTLNDVDSSTPGVDVLIARAGPD